MISLQQIPSSPRPSIPAVQFTAPPVQLVAALFGPRVKRPERRVADSKSVLEIRLGMNGALPLHPFCPCMTCCVETFTFNRVIYTRRFEGRYSLHLQGLRSL